MRYPAAMQLGTDTVMLPLTGELLVVGSRVLRAAGLRLPSLTIKLGSTGKYLGVPAGPRHTALVSLTSP
jgi:hypothetical protein